MFISNAELFRIKRELKTLAREIEFLRGDLAGKASKHDESKWADAVDADLRAEVALLADAIGYERIGYGSRYEKKRAKAK